jgi:predicted phage terminase large subunit-like protein
MLKRNPKLNIILGSYNQKLANRISRRVRRVIENKVELSQERCAAEEWETKQGGGVRAVGVGAGVTGFGAGLIIIDDPVKGRAHAESTAFRETCLDWFNDDIYTRQEPGAAIILIQTRWHDDDLAGHLLKEMKEPGGEKWEVVKLPALAEGEGGKGRKGEEEPEHTTPSAEAAATPPDSGGVLRDVTAGSRHDSRQDAGATQGDPLGRSPGEALCPDRYNEEALHRIRQKLGAYSFSALFQQSPIPAEGGLFNRKWFGKDKIVARAPDLARWARGYDLAVSTRTSADYTASFRCGFDTQGNLFIADGFRKRIEYPEQRRYVVERMTTEKNTRHGIEKALHGQAFVQDLRRIPAVRGVAFKAVKVDADKYTRALAWANLAEEGRVYLVQGPWINDFLEEICRFTGRGDTHDDQVDAVSLAVGLLKGPGGKSFGW